MLDARDETDQSEAPGAAANDGTERSDDLRDLDGVERDGDEGDGDEHLGTVARWVGSPDTMVWAKRGVLVACLLFLFASIGYLVGVKSTLPAEGNAVDEGFLQDMTEHHDQAVSMAIDEMANGSDKVVKDFAKEVLLFQRQEIGLMQAYQGQHGFEPAEYSPDRTTMAWMGMPTALKDMPGMATPEQMEQLSKAKGTDSDKLFLTLMQNHHLGGVHMSEYAATHAADPKVRALAQRMATNQRIEVKEYQQVIDRLNAK